MTIILITFRPESKPLHPRFPTRAGHNPFNRRCRFDWTETLNRNGLVQSKYLMQTKKNGLPGFLPVRSPEMPGSWAAISAVWLFRIYWKAFLMKQNWFFSERNLCFFNQVNFLHYFCNARVWRCYHSDTHTASLPKVNKRWRKDWVCFYFTLGGDAQILCCWLPN